jgi:hypothetical protein
MILRKRLTLPPVLAAAVIFAAAAGALCAGVPPEVKAKAAAIFAALERIEAEAARPAPTRPLTATPAPKPGSRSVTFSEAELNAYAACRVEAEGGPYVKAAELKLLAGNRIEGRIAIDLGKSQASGIMAQKQDLLFAARVETENGRIRINMDKLYLGTQAIAPALIDAIIGVVSRLQGVEPTSLKDWYELPPGVQRLESRPGQVVIIY